MAVVTSSLAGAHFFAPGDWPYTALAMHPFNQKPEMSSAEFNAALREAGFGVDHGQIVDVSGKCPGFIAMPSFRKGVVNRRATLAKVIRERDAEIARRGGTAESAG
jgi:hypothetical protein